MAVSALKLEWPHWCLNRLVPCIQVYVEDDISGEGFWIDAEPVGRILDAAGCDAFLNVEYEWDGELYLQECGPCMVRKRGHVETVYELLENTCSEPEEIDVAREDDENGPAEDFGEVQDDCVTSPNVEQTDATAEQANDEKMHPIVEGFDSNSLHYAHFDDYVAALSAQEPVHKAQDRISFGRLWPFEWLSADYYDSKLPLHSKDTKSAIVDFAEMFLAASGLKSTSGATVPIGDDLV